VIKDLVYVLAGNLKGVIQFCFFVVYTKSFIRGIYNELCMLIFKILFFRKIS